MKKVVHYISTLKGGGAQTQVILLCNELDKTQFKAYIVCWDRDSAIALSPDVNVIVVERGSKWNLLSYINRNIKVSREIGPDIIHLWLPEILTVPIAFYGWLSGIPIVSGERRVPTEKLGMLWLRDRIKYLAHVLSSRVVSNFPMPISRKSFFNLIVKFKKGVTIYNGVSASNIVKSDRVRPAGRPFTLAYCGRLVPQKNVDVLIKSIGQLRDAGFHANLDIYGEGELEHQLKQLTADLNLSQHIAFHGYKKNWKELAQYADCFILPSSREGMPNVLFEAIVIGLPIISTTIEEIACHFTDGYDSILVNSIDVKSLSDAIYRAGSNAELLFAIKTNAYKTIEKYAIPNMARSYEDLYHSLPS